MTEHFGTKFPQFYMTMPSPCPYLPGLQEKKVFTHLLSDDALELNNTLTHAGFRRSQNIAYRPACDGCDACISVRVQAENFKPSRNFRKILARNADLTRTLTTPKATDEQFALLRTYLDTRHPDGGMADMTQSDYQSMIEDTTVDTTLIEYREPSTPQAPQGRLIAAALSDTLHDGLSMVYSFFNPEAEARSLGTFMVLDHIVQTQDLGLPYVYLGYWVEECRKMAYKTRFRPVEALGHDGWQILETPDL